jgi:uncharacterized protein (DUF2384 family)
MAKAIKKYNPPKDIATTAKEPISAYFTPPRLTTDTVDFSYKKFQKIANKMPFTQKEWAQMLHLSERTLQRYAKDNIGFQGMYADRILQLQQLIDMGLETFTNATAFYNWLKKEKKVLGHVINFESLHSSQGISDIIAQLGRIQYGVYT